MQFENPNMDDIQSVFELLTRSDIAEYGEPDSELSDLHHAWSRLDLSKDAWVVRGEGAVILGYGAVIPEQDDVRVDVYVDPEQVGDGLDGNLLSRCETRVGSMAVSEEITGRTFVAHVNEDAAEIFLSAGFRYQKSYYQFHIDLFQDLEIPIWPEGIALRTALPEEDDEAIYRAVQTAFEHPIDEAPTFDQWRAHMIRPEVYDPALWFLAVHGEEIVGMSLGVKYETEGWIRQLGVIPDWRRKGIATALLRHAFLAFREREYNRVGLGMEAKNEQALNFYKDVGMVIRRQYDEYSKGYLPS